MQSKERFALGVFVNDDRLLRKTVRHQVFAQSDAAGVKTRSRVFDAAGIAPDKSAGDGGGQAEQCGEYLQTVDGRHGPDAPERVPREAANHPGIVNVVNR